MKILLVVVLLAVAVYLLVRTLDRRRGTTPSSPTPPRPVGPDDDPDFLRGLDRRPDGDDGDR